MAVRAVGQQVLQNAEESVLFKAVPAPFAWETNATFKRMGFKSLDSFNGSFIFEDDTYEANI